MSYLDESLRAITQDLEKISDTKLDKLIAEIDKMDISGPSVDEYFSSINKSIGSFFDEPNETSTIAEVESMFRDTRIEGTSVYSIPNRTFSSAFHVEFTENSFCYLGSENSLPMAA